MLCSLLVSGYDLENEVHYMRRLVSGHGLKNEVFQRRFLERGIKNCGSQLCLLLKIVADYEEAFI